MRTHAIRPRRVHDFVSSIFDYDLHAKRVASLADATVGALQGAQLAVGALGRALAVAKEPDGKHAIKQVDRFFSNTGVDVWKLFANWVPFVIARRPEIVVALDWTDFDQDDQSTIALHLITKHGRATPLLWKSVVKSEMEGWRNEHEDALLERFAEVVPKGTRVTVLADRGFGDQALYELLKDQLAFDFVVRFRGVVKVESADGETKPAKAWVPASGRPLLLRKARVTRTRREIGAVVCVKAKGMKEAWCLATSHEERTGAEIREALRAAVHHRGELPRPQEPALRHGAHRHAHQHASPARPHSPGRRHRGRAADAARRGGGGRRRRPPDEGEHLEGTGPFAAQPGIVLLRLPPQHARRARQTADGEVR